MTTVASLQRITAPKLADLLRAANAATTTKDAGTTPEQQADSSPSIAVVDVRDDDHLGGHIRGSLHFPSRSLDATMPTILRKLDGKDTVVFHCALSQQRGPSAALRYLRERKAAGKKQGEGGQTVYVLDRGFVGWQELFGLDETLTEGYRKEFWEDGY